MLVLSRRAGQELVIGGNIIVKVVRVANKVTLAIDAPRETPILRGELVEKMALKQGSH